MPCVFLFGECKLASVVLQAVRRCRRWASAPGTARLVFDHMLSDMSKLCLESLRSPLTDQWFQYRQPTIQWMYTTSLNLYGKTLGATKPLFIALHRFFPQLDCDCDYLTLLPGYAQRQKPKTKLIFNIIDFSPAKTKLYNWMTMIGIMTGTDRK